MFMSFSLEPVMNLKHSTTLGPDCKARKEAVTGRFLHCLSRLISLESGKHLPLSLFPSLSLSRMKLDIFTAHVRVAGRDTKEYAVEYDHDRRKATCYIESDAGKVNNQPPLPRFSMPGFCS
jgi:hypothetical protein